MKRSNKENKRQSNIKKSHVKIVSFGCALISAPLAVVASSGSTVTLQNMGYHESDARMDVNYTQFSLAHEIGVDYTLSASGSIDVMSGATPVVDAKTGASQMSINEQGFLGDGLTTAEGYTTHFMQMDDERTSFNSSLTWRMPQTRHEITAGLSYSKEEDYLSQGFSVEHLRNVDASRNRSFTLGYSLLKNEALFYREGVYKDATYQTIELGLTEVVSAQTLLRGAVFVMFEDGALSNPYKRVIRKVNIGDAQTVVFRYFLAPDSRPDKRRVVGADVKVSHYENVFEQSVFMHGQYRLYVDDWGIISHTFESKLYIGDTPISYGQFFTGLRIYTQS
ncbi:MAG: DUF3570 domain-containing protein, partial [Saccharospirillaceae bacterium]|nr:DUF3570 domain-containing protein [Pseudomonadales bacterium]NRB81421.1 DUF3570 domain-containing protein [Saccharospirillaceae bacterium]